MTPLDELPSPAATVSSPDRRDEPGGSPAVATSQGAELLVLALVTALALLLASSPARNTDLWWYLANGRLLAHGDFSALRDARLLPFDTGVNHFWLYGLLSYGVNAALGDLGLLLLKVLLALGLVGVLFRVSWRRAGWWIPAVCTALALLAVSMRWPVQPVMVSYFLLALTIWLLWKDEGGRMKDESSFILPPSSFGLFILFIAWVNVDVWFLLGLGTVALVWMGQIIDAAVSPRQGWGRLALTRAVGFAALCAVCLLNPAHVKVFSSAAELLWSEHAQFPYDWVQRANFLVNPAGLAYSPLLKLPLLLFFLNLPRASWQRFLPWLGLAALTPFYLRAVPFFAIVAGPVLAWNIHAFLAQRAGSVSDRSDTRQQWAYDLGRALTLLLAVALVICAWPGWLQGPPYEPRRWAVETPPSLESGAAASQHWLREGKLGADPKTLYLSRESAYAFAWFCPEAKSVRDDKLASAILKDPGASSDWGPQMRAAGINYVILYEPDHGKLSGALGGLMANAEQWPLLYLEGDVAAFGWRDPAALDSGDSFRDWQLDFNRLAFHPAEDKKAPAELPNREPEVREWWDAFWKATPPRPTDREEATLYLFLAEPLRRAAPQRHLAAWQGSQAAGLLGATAGWTGPAGLLDARVRLTLLQPVLDADTSAAAATFTPLGHMAVGMYQMYAGQRDDLPPALLYLAIRAARRAVAANPKDPEPYVILGVSYMRLLHSTRERFWSKGMNELVDLRHAQASAAFNQAISLKADYTEAHRNLAKLYQEMGYLDLELEHLRIYVKLTSDAGPDKDADPEQVEQFREEKKRTQDYLDQLTNHVDELESAYRVEAGQARGVLDRAGLAHNRGLSGKARDLLKKSDISAFGRRGAQLELELLLRTGRASDVQDWTSPELEGAVGSANYHWLRAQAAAASGNYALAQEECKKLARAADSPGHGVPPDVIRQLMAVLVSQTVAGEQPAGVQLPQLFWLGFNHVAFQLKLVELAKSLRIDADVGVLWALITLERGDVDEAETALRTALAYWRNAAAVTSGATLNFNGRPVAQGYLELLGK